MRKTVTVAKMRESLNGALANADYQDETMGLDVARGYRWGLIGALETVLHETGNYRGFRYTDPKAEYDDGIVEGTYDETRRAYYGG